MTPSDIIKALQTAGGSIWLDGLGRLHVAGGDRKVPAWLPPEIRANSGELKDHLAQIEQDQAGANLAISDEVSVGGHVIPFRAYCPGDRLAGPEIGIDFETELIDDKAPGRPFPRPVLGTVCDLEQGLYLRPQDVDRFLRDHRKKRFVTWNGAAFDLWVAEKAIKDNGGSFDVWKLVDRNRFRDGMVLERLLSLAKHDHTRSVSLDLACRHYLGEKVVKDLVDSSGDLVRTTFKKYLGRPLSLIEPIARIYAAGDALASLLIYPRQVDEALRLIHDCEGDFEFPGLDEVKDAWRRYGVLTHHVQVKAAIVGRWIEQVGVHVHEEDRELLLELLNARKDAAAEELIKAGILSTSPKKGQLSTTAAMRAYVAETEERLLADKTLSKPLPRTPKGMISLGKDNLGDIAAVDPLIEIYLEFDQAKRWIGNYAKNLTAGRLHPKVNTLLVTGRMSMSKPALQTLPKCPKVKPGEPAPQTIRGLLKPPKGYLWVGGDFSTLETRSLARVLTSRGHDGLQRMIEDGIDVHASIAIAIHKDRIGPVSKQERDRAKPFTFGAPGGMRPPTLQSTAWTGYRVRMTLKEAEIAYEAILETIPGLREYVQSTTDPIENLSTSTGLSKSAIWQMLDVLQGNTETRFGEGIDPEFADSVWQWAQSLPGLFYEDDRVRRDALSRKISEREAGVGLMLEIKNWFGSERVWTRTGRLRGRCITTQSRNCPFQGLASDGMTLGLYRLFRMGYQIPLPVHDECYVLVREDDDIGAHVRTVSQVMTEEMESVIGVQIGFDPVVKRSYSDLDRVEFSTSSPDRDSL